MMNSTSNTHDDSISMLAWALDEWDDVGILCWHENGQISGVSRGFGALFGATVSAGMPVAEVWNEIRRLCADDPGDLATAFAVASRRDLKIDAEPAMRWLDCSLRHLPDAADGWLMLVRDITMQRATEHSDDLFQTVLNNLPDAAIVVSPERRILQANQALQQLFGYPQTELVGRRTNLLYAEAADYHAQGRNMRDPDNQSHFKPYMMRYRHADGSVFCGETVSGVIRQHHGGLIGHIGIIRDISERLRTEQELKRYQDIVAASSDALAFIDTAFKYLAVNQTYLDFWQLTREHILQRPVKEVVGEAFFNALVKPCLLQCLDGSHQQASFVDQIPMPLGPPRHIEAIYTPSRDSQGEICGVVANIRDVTARVATEQALRASEQRARALLEAIPDLMFRLDCHGVYLDYKASRADLVMQQAETLVGLNIRDIAPAPFANLILEKIALTLASGELQAFEYPLEIPGRGWRHWEARMVPSGSDEIIATVRDISEQKAAAARLYTLSQIVEQSPDAILLTDDQFRISYINQSFKTLYGYSLEEIHGQMPGLLNAESEAAQHQQALYNTLTSGKKAFDQMINRRKNGSLFHCQYWISPLRDEQDGIIGYMGSQRDVSEQIRAEHALEASEAQYRQIVETAMEGIWVIDADAHTRFVNARMGQMLGQAPDEMIGKSLYHFIRPQDTPPAKQQLDRLRQGVSAIHEIRFLRRDGTELWAIVSAMPKKNADNQFSGAFAMLTDITERKRAELALRDSESRYRTLYEQIPQGVVVHRHDGSIMAANPAAQRILGLSLEEFIQRPQHSPSWRCIYEDGSDFPNDKHPAMRALRSGEPVKNVVMGVFNPRRQDFVWIHVDATPLRAFGDTEKNGVFSTFSDISETHALQQALIQSQKMEAIGRLTGGIAHDFNNILGSVLGFAELARLHNNDQDPKLSHYLRQIDIASGRARDLVRQLLVFSRGERTTAARPTPLVPIVKEIMKLLRPSLPATIKINLLTTDSETTVTIDPLHLQQLLMNLCLNARDAMQGNGLLRITVTRTHPSGEQCLLCGHRLNGDWVELAVADSGDGIAATNRDWLFQPFFTTKGIGEGSGMGLAVVSGIMQTYQGHVLLRSQPGQGAEFRLLLPPAAPSHEATPADPEDDLSAHNASTTPASAGLRILVVDDENTICQFYSELLSQSGAQVSSCADGSSALQTFKAAAFDLVISDLTMPGMSGLELVRRIRTINRKVPILICSGYSNAVDAKIREQLAIADVLLKPVRASELLGSIEETLKSAPQP
jgi:two-component system cell cycle sensor histidine kinase/response regulator CckA